MRSRRRIATLWWMGLPVLGIATMGLLSHGPPPRGVVAWGSLFGEIAAAGVLMAAASTLVTDGLGALVGVFRRRRPIR